MSKISDAGNAPRKRPSSPENNAKSKPADRKKDQRRKPRAAGEQKAPPRKSANKPDNRRAAWKTRKDGASKGTTDRDTQGKDKKVTGFEGFAARQAAIILLQNVLTRRRPMDELLNQADRIPELKRLTKADRAFARAIAATALRRHGQLMDVLNNFMEKGLPQRSGPLEEILVSASAQLLILESPPHAVINIAVQQVKRHQDSARYDKLANAVLRRVSEKGPALVKKQIEEQKVGRLNTPNWLWNSWVRAYGKQQASYICEAHLHQAQLDLSVKSDPAGWTERLGGIELPTGSVRLRQKGRVENIEGFDDGEWWVQDVAASLPVQLMGDIKGKQVADLAAAPGGKTAQMAVAGADVIAIDWSKGRLKRLVENLERLELDAEIIEADIMQWEPDEKLDAVLLDAPCSSTGTIRRHPDLPFLKKESDVKELAVIQSKLLDRALTFVKPGGTLIYCTCSLQNEEGPDQIEALLKRHKNVTLDQIKPEELAGHEEWITEQGTLRTLPFHRPTKKATPGMDGFFAARLIMG